MQFPDAPTSYGCSSLFSVSFWLWLIMRILHVVFTRIYCETEWHVKAENQIEPKGKSAISLKQFTQCEGETTTWTWAKAHASKLLSDFIECWAKKIAHVVIGLLLCWVEGNTKCDNRCRSVFLVRHKRRPSTTGI